MKTQPMHTLCMCYGGATKKPSHLPKKHEQKRRPFWEKPLFLKIYNIIAQGSQNNPIRLYSAEF